MVLARSCGLNRVVATLASTLGEKEDNLRQRLREWFWEKEQKKGAQRSDWEVRQSFEPLLKWVLSLWQAEGRQLALAMDATSLKKIFVVLSISVVYRGCAIPVAWAVLPEGKPGSWKEPWLSLFQDLQSAIPPDWKVIVMADRGLYARWLWESIRACGWHPFLRINAQSMYRPKGKSAFLHMSQLLPSPGMVWAKRVTCFRHNSVEGTLLACWGAQYKEPWFILTDLPPKAASASWYAMRSWIEDCFKDFKRDGWQWQKTRMLDPARAARFWLALAVATLWVVSVGGEADASCSPSSLDHLPPSHIARTSKSHAAQPRTLSCFSRGLIVILAALLAQRFPQLGALLPEPWPLKTYP